MNVITSRQHPLCKLVRALNNARERRKRGLFVVPGGNAVTAALAARWPLERIIVSPDDAADGWEQIAQSADVPLVLADEAILEYIGDVPSAPDVLAIARMPQSERTTFPDSGLILVLDGISDPGNVGTLIRSADAAGAGAIITAQNSADAFGLKAVRASAGSVFHLPPLSLEDNSSENLAARLQSENVPIITAVAHKGQSCFEYRWPARCALVLGHETRGVSPIWQEAASARITIPIFGRAESLNVAGAGAVLLYAWRNSSSR
jgi:TrmH family RNA methyltransferase